MPEQTRRLIVFLCHAHSDATAVRDLFWYLRREGVDVWLDKEKLLPGADWDREIRKAVRASDVVVVCVSKQFNQAGYRQKEVKIALDAALHKTEGEIFIIPARLEECEVPDSFSKWHWVDLFEEGGRQKLIYALRAQAQSVGAGLRGRRGSRPGEAHEESEELYEVDEPTDRQREALQDYLAQMKELLIEKQLRTSPTEEVQNFARMLTLAVLRSLDAKGKGFVLRFLYESGLVIRPSVINLWEADLSRADMSGARLSEVDLTAVNLKHANLTSIDLTRAYLNLADLSGAYMKQARLDGAQLTSANLSHTNLTNGVLVLASLYNANLEGAILVGSNLQEVDLTAANLTEANLKGANLTNAKLLGADFSEADLTQARGVGPQELADAISLKGTIMPDRTRHE